MSHHRVSLNARRFQKGEWESLWNQTLKHNNSELAHRAKKLDGNAPAPASIRARARYAEYCARKGALSWWEEEDGQEYIRKHFNVQKIAKYLHPIAGVRSRR